MSNGRGGRTAGLLKKTAIALDPVEKLKRNRAILKSVLGAAVCVNAALGLALVYFVFLHVPYFNLQAVDVIGARHLSSAELEETAEIEPGVNLLTVNLNSVAEKLKKHPWIRSASVYRRFPGRLIIEIQERNPRAILATDRLYYVDEQGEVFTRVLPGHSVGYPLFTGVTPAELKSRTSEVRDIVREGLALLDFLEKAESDISAASVAEVEVRLDQGLALKTISNRTIVLGRGALQAKLQRYERLKRFLTRRGKWNNARIIDLDFEDRALVTHGGPRIQG